jgi:hypothetical protein
MPRRRVFRTRATCPGVRDDLRLTANRRTFIGRIVALERLHAGHVPRLHLSVQVAAGRIRLRVRFLE